MALLLIVLSNDHFFAEIKIYSDDDVTQFKKWNIGQNTWDDISLYSLLIELEQRIPIGEYLSRIFKIRFSLSYDGNN